MNNIDKLKNEYNSLITMANDTLSDCSRCIKFISDIENYKNNNLNKNVKTKLNTYKRNIQSIEMELKKITKVANV